MKKILAILLILILTPTAEAAQVRYNNNPVQLKTTNINGLHYASKNEFNSLLSVGNSVYKQDSVEPIRQLATQNNLFVQWEGKTDTILLNQKHPEVTEKIIGYSTMGQPIKATMITPPYYTETILITFAVHGFEDSWYRDGQVLVKTGEEVIKYFTENPDKINITKLAVIPCVNPDGTYYGNSNAGFGRCNSEGIDINRDFDHYFVASRGSRYRSGEQPFSSVEAQALRDFVLQEKPTIVIDIHGWEGCLFGNKELSEPFIKHFAVPFIDTENKPTPMQNYFTGWASKQAKVLLVEYPDPGNEKNFHDWKYIDNTITAIENTIQ